MPAPEATPEPVVRPGDLVARKYRVDRVIGVGGMGMVVAATHVALRQEVALKVMLPAALSNTESIERFLREGRAVAKLRSPHVPRVLDVGTLETGEPYMVMELLEGEDLGHLLSRSGPLPVADAVDYVRQACGALDDAHAMGIVHRDLKPGNLFLAKDPRGAAVVKVLDFGISKSMEQDPTNLALTATSAVMGSPLYMSPEQMRASRNVDARTDIWSLGITLYELLMGEVPFHAESPMELGAKVLHDTPVPPIERRPEVPPAVNEVILRCLEKDPSRRFPDAAALEHALAEASRSAGAPTGALPLVSTGPRVTLGPSGTPASGSRTLPYSDTQMADTQPRWRRGPRWIAMAAAIATLGGGAFFVLRSPHTAPTAVSVPSAPPPALPPSAMPSTDTPPVPTASAPVMVSPSASASPTMTVATPRPGPPFAPPGPTRSARPAPSPRPPPANPPPVTAAPSAGTNNPLDHL